MVILLHRRAVGAPSTLERVFALILLLYALSATPAAYSHHPMLPLSDKQYVAAGASRPQTAPLSPERQGIALWGGRASKLGLTPPPQRLSSGLGGSGPPPNACRVGLGGQDPSPTLVEWAWGVSGPGRPPVPRISTLICSNVLYVGRAADESNAVTITKISNLF